MAKLASLLGNALGWSWAPPIAAVARARRARMFHPDGIALAATVEPIVGVAQRLTEVGALLAGPAIVRMSSALWRQPAELVDALGLAVRLRSDPAITAEPAPGDQDLLFATIKRPWTTLLAPLTTHVHDFLANDYFAVSPFAVPGFGLAKWRLARLPRRPGDADDLVSMKREARLLRDVERGDAVLRFEIAEAPIGRWQPVAHLRLERPVEIDQEALRFDPFRNGRGIVPRGFVHALRRGAYAASQAARPR